MFSNFADSISLANSSRHMNKYIHVKFYREKYNAVQPTKSLKSRGRFQDVTNITDILSSVVNSIIHVSILNI